MMAALAAVQAAAQAAALQGALYSPSCPTPPLNWTEYMLRPLLRDKMNGMTLYDWNRRVETKHAGAIGLIDNMGIIRRNTSADYVAITPMLVTPNISSTSIVSHVNWTMSDDTIRAITKQAHSVGMRVMLKLHVKLGCVLGTSSPACTNDCQIWGPHPNQKCGRDNIGGNMGGIYGTAFTVAQWDRWFTAYSSHVLHYAALVKAEGVEAFCIATELTGPFVGKADTNAAVTQHWRELLKQTRQAVGSGAVKLLVAMHEWDLEKGAAFMDAPQLDLIGFDVYRSFAQLQQVQTPTVEAFSRAWFTRGEYTNAHHVPQPCVSPFDWYSNVSKFYQKPVVFSEWGYKSCNACGSADAQANPGGNQDCQANAFTAAQELLGRADWWAGGFWWDWTAASFDAASLGADGKMELQKQMQKEWN